MNLRDRIYNGSKALRTNFVRRILYYSAVFCVLSLVTESYVLPLGTGVTGMLLSALVMGSVFAGIHWYLFDRTAKGRRG